MTKEGYTKIINFMTHGVGVLMLGDNHISYYSEQHIDCYYLEIIMLFSYVFVDFHSF